MYPHLAVCDSCGGVYKYLTSLKNLNRGIFKNGLECLVNFYPIQH